MARKGIGAGYASWTPKWVCRMQFADLVDEVNLRNSFRK